MCQGKKTAQPCHGTECAFDNALHSRAIVGIPTHCALCTHPHMFAYGIFQGLCILGCSPRPTLFDSPSFSVLCLVVFTTRALFAHRSHKHTHSLFVPFVWIGLSFCFSLFLSAFFQQNAHIRILLFSCTLDVRCTCSAIPSLVRIINSLAESQSGDYRRCHEVLFLLPIDNKLLSDGEKWEKTTMCPFDMHAWRNGMGQALSLS